MKTLMQRFTKWFNRTHARSGNLWEDAFKSVIVEDGVAAKTIAAYIDLNPVRAGMVKDPAEYRWSSYGEAIGGGAKGNGKKARAGLVRALRAHQGGGADAALWAKDVAQGIPADIDGGGGGEVGVPSGPGWHTGNEAQAQGDERRGGGEGASEAGGYSVRQDVALPGEVFHGWGGDREPEFRERGVCGRAGALWPAAQGRGAQAAWQRRGCGGLAVERAGLEKWNQVRSGQWQIVRKKVTATSGNEPGRVLGKSQRPRLRS